MLSRGRAFVKDLLSVFEKLDGERSSCPRCKGTGLLRCRRTWPWSRADNSNGPCWFCEGIGAMPIYGLEGFFLGRTPTLFRTEDLKEPVDSPVKLHLCLGKYPETRSLLKSCKPSKQMQEALKTQWEPTCWSPDATKRPALRSKYEGESSDHFRTGWDIYHSSEGFSAIPSVMGSLDPSGIFFHHDFDIRGKETAVLELPIHLETWYSHRADTVKGAQRTANFGGNGIDLGRPARLLPVTTREPDFPQPTPSQQESEGGYVEGLRGTRGTPRRKRSVTRNQLRVKAEREAAERALRRRKLKPSESSENPAPAGPSAPVWSHSGSWRDLSSAWLAEETARRRAVESSKQSEAAEGNSSAPGVVPERQALFAGLVLTLFSSTSGV